MSMPLQCGNFNAHKKHNFFFFIVSLNAFIAEHKGLKKGFILHVNLSTILSELTNESKNNLPFD